MHPSSPSGAPIGVLFMAYGGPQALDDLPGYLADIRDPRPTTPEVLGEIAHNYASIGGRSPLLELTLAQIDGAMRALNGPGAPAPLGPDAYRALAEGVGEAPPGPDTVRTRGHAYPLSCAPGRFRAYLGMRHWAPWVEETVGQMLEDGVERAVAIVLAPHFSTLSIQKYQAKVEAGMAMHRGRLDVAYVDAYFDAPGLVAPLAARARAGVAAFPEAEQGDVHVVFSAHSLPVRILKTGDPYDAQLRTTARLVAEAAGLPEERWSWSYQSAGRSPEPWLGPQIQDHVADLAARGVRKVVSVPVGFVCDHVEVLYDIDQQAQAVAREVGTTLVRPPSLNDDPAFTAQLGALVRARAEAAGWF